MCSQVQCPACNSANIIKNGSIHNGKQKFMCKDCKRQFIEKPTKKTISDETWELVDKLLLEKIPIAGIARVTGISEQWLQQYINDKYENIPQKIEIDISELKLGEAIHVSDLSLSDKVKILNFMDQSVVGVTTVKAEEEPEEDEELEDEEEGEETADAESETEE